MNKDARELLISYLTTQSLIIVIPMIILLYRPSADSLSRFLEIHKCDREDLLHAWVAYSLAVSAPGLVFMYPRSKRLSLRLSPKGKDGFQ